MLILIMLQIGLMQYCSFDGLLQFSSTLCLTIIFDIRRREWKFVIVGINTFLLLCRWEFTGTEEEEAKSIPYQLQKLFLHLQVFQL